MKNFHTTLFHNFLRIFSQFNYQRAQAKNLVEIEIVNIRDFTLDKYSRVDSAPVGEALV